MDASGAVYSYPKDGLGTEKTDESEETCDGSKEGGNEIECYLPGWPADENVSNSTLCPVFRST